MKKIYKAPRILVVQIRTSHMLAESLYFREGNISDENAVLTKEYNNNSLNRNVWDEEW